MTELAFQALGPEQLRQGGRRERRILASLWAGQMDECSGVWVLTCALDYS